LKPLQFARGAAVRAAAARAVVAIEADLDKK
jgi:hypothetical protein